MKRLIKTLSIFLSFCFLLIMPFSYGCSTKKNSSEITPENIPAWKSLYVPMVHKQKIKESIMSQYTAYRIKEIRFETVFSYWTEDPEYLLVTLEYKNDLTGTFERDGVTYEYRTKYAHTILRLGYSCCYVTYMYANETDDYRTEWGIFCYGLSPYEICGYKYNKKFFTGHDILAVETEQGLMKIYSPKYSFDRREEWEYDFVDVAPRNEDRFIQRMEIMEPKNLKQLLYKSRYVELGDNCRPWPYFLTSEDYLT